LCTLPCNKVESGDAANVDRAKVKGRRTRIGEVKALIAGNQDREMGRRIIKGSIFGNSSRDIVRREGEMLTNLEDIATKILLVGFSRVKRAKRTTKLIDISAEVLGTMTNLKSKRMGVVGRKSTFHNINLIERREGYLHVGSGIFKMNLIIGKFIAEKFDIRRRILTVHHAFVESDMASGLDEVGFKIQVVCVTH
jgi:hypothetical protein